MGGAETPYATVVEVLDGDTMKADTQGSTVGVRLIGVDKRETVAPDHLTGCYGPEASEFTKKPSPVHLLSPLQPRLYRSTPTPPSPVAS